MTDRLITLVLLSLAALGSTANGHCPYGGRCLPDEPCWPSYDQWQALNASVGGRLTVPRLTVQPCLEEEGGDSAECRQSLDDLGYDPYYLETFPNGYTHQTGVANGFSPDGSLTGGWVAAASSYAVEALDEDDIVSAVNFARDFNLRLVVKSTGHDLQGRSSAPDSLLVWTHSMRDMQFHDEFVPAGGEEAASAVTLGAGLTWTDVYGAAALDRDLFVMGGAEPSVGVVGWGIGGGFGAQSKKFGTGAANMLEARVVTAAGQVVVASEFENEDLFFALRGGGFGFGVVVSLTVRTYPLPSYFGWMVGSVVARSREAAREMLRGFLDFTKNSLLGQNSYWGESVFFEPVGEGGYRMSIAMSSVDLTAEESTAVWQQFGDWLDQSAHNYSYVWVPTVLPGKEWFDVNLNSFGGVITLPSPHDPREPDRGYFLTFDRSFMSSHVMWRMSRYLTYEHVLEDTQAGMEKLMRLFDAIGGGSISFSKGLGPGASEWALREQDKTAMPPSVKDAIGHVLTFGNINQYSPVVPDELQTETSNIDYWLEFCGSGGIENCEALIPFYEAANLFRQETPGAGAYFNEADTFELEWQEQFWGSDNYEALLGVKEKWDPEGLFVCRQCVGSEDWDEGGMCRSRQRRRRS